MVRLADFNDLERLTELFIKLHRHHVDMMPEAFTMPEHEWFVERIADILSDVGQKVLVYDSGCIEAYAVIRKIEVDTPDKPPRRICFIDQFFVSESRRRQGVGTELFNAVKAFGREKGCASVQLGVSAGNAGAVGFYDKMGLTPRTVQMEAKL